MKALRRKKRQSLCHIELTPHTARIAIIPLDNRAIRLRLEADPLTIHSRISKRFSNEHPYPFSVGSWRGVKSRPILYRIPEVYRGKIR